MKAKIVLVTLFLYLVQAEASAQQKIVRKGTQTAGKPPQEKTMDPLYRLEQFQGKWQEVKRTSLTTKEKIEFTDSLLLKFEGNKVEIKDVISMRISMKGTAQVEAPNFLVAAGDEFTVKYVDKYKLILDDGEHLKELEKKEQFNYESFGKQTVEKDTLNSPVAIDPKIAEGKWMVYRRQALAGSVNEEAVVIKSIEIFSSDTQGSSTGEVVFYQANITESLPCKIIFSAATILIITDKNNWEFSTYKLNEKEFVFGEKDRLMYYAKRMQN
jgi:hypothetical protein